MKDILKMIMFLGGGVLLAKYASDKFKQSANKSTATPNAVFGVRG